MTVDNLESAAGLLAPGDAFRLPGGDPRIFVVVTPNAGSGVTGPPGKVLYADLAGGLLSAADPAMAVIRLPAAVVRPS